MHEPSQSRDKRANELPSFRPTLVLPAAREAGCQAVAVQYEKEERKKSEGKKNAEEEERRRKERGGDRAHRSLDANARPLAAPHVRRFLERKS